MPPCPASYRTNRQHTNSIFPNAAKNTFATGGHNVSTWLVCRGWTSRSRRQNEHQNRHLSEADGLCRLHVFLPERARLARYLLFRLAGGRLGFSPALCDAEIELCMVGRVTKRRLIHDDKRPESKCSPFKVIVHPLAVKKVAEFFLAKPIKLVLTAWPSRHAPGEENKGNSDHDEH